MLTRSEKVILAGLLLFNLVLWGFFGTALFCFHDSFSFSSDFFHAMTSLDWDLVISQAQLMKKVGEGTALISPVERGEKSMKSIRVLISQKLWA